jgi:hypothetical protein
MKLEGSEERGLWIAVFVKELKAMSTYDQDAMSPEAVAQIEVKRAAVLADAAVLKFRPRDGSRP